MNLPEYKDGRKKVVNQLLPIKKQAVSSPTIIDNKTVEEVTYGDGRARYTVSPGASAPSSDQLSLLLFKHQIYLFHKHFSPPIA